jgi:hypothetical protein
MCIVASNLRMQTKRSRLDLTALPTNIAKLSRLSSVNTLRLAESVPQAHSMPLLPSLFQKLTLPFYPDGLMITVNLTQTQL